MVYPFLHFGSEVSSCEGGNPYKDWIPDQVRNDKIYGLKDCVNYLLTPLMAS